jgi:hypothetical protein
MQLGTTDEEDIQELRRSLQEDDDWDEDVSFGRMA